MLTENHTMKKEFVHVFETRSAAVNFLHFIAKITSRMTVRHECLVDYEQHIPYVKCSLTYLKLGYMNSLTFGFRVIGFDYATTKFYNSDYRKDKGDIVSKFEVTYSNRCYFIKLIE